MNLKKVLVHGMVFLARIPFIIVITWHGVEGDELHFMFVCPLLYVTLEWFHPLPATANQFSRMFICQRDCCTAVWHVK